MTTAAPRLLFVSHHFPPDTSIGSKRSHRIACQMAARGWQVDVLCAHELYQDGYDLSLMAGLETVNIVRTQELNPRAWARWAREKLQGGDDMSVVQTQKKTNNAPNSETDDTSVGALSKLLRGLSANYSRWVELPDQWSGWLAPALTTAQTLQRPDVVLATIPPSTSALVATAIAKRFNVPLVLDYRDPWHAAGRRPDLPRARRQLEIWLETRCHMQAAALVTVTPGLADEIGNQVGRHVHLVPNACEPERLADIVPMAFDRPTIVYTGSLYGGRSVEPVLQSMARLRAAGDLDKASIGLLVMGQDNDHVTQQADALGVADLVEVMARQSHNVAISAALGASMNLLLVAPQHKVQVPAKVFEQLAAGKPILVLGPQGADVERFLADTDAARCAQPEDNAVIDEALRDLVSGSWQSRAQVPQQFTVAATMDKLDDLLRRVCGQRSERTLKTATVKLAATGDLMLPPDVQDRLKADPKKTLGPVGAALRAADIAFGNLETPVVRSAQPVPSSNPLQPVFVAPYQAAGWLRQAGYTVLNMANNHITDAGGEGIVETRAACVAAGIMAVGAGRNLAEARRPAVVEVDGFSVGFLGYSSFEAATPTSPGTAPMHVSTMVADVARLRLQVDRVVVSVHTGIEYAALPTSGFREICHALIGAGAHLVLGHHPHVYQGHERVGDGMIVYSLGNTLADTIDPTVKRLAFERTTLVRTGLRELAPDEPRLEDAVVVTSDLAQDRLQIDLQLHRLREDLCIHPCRAAEQERFDRELQAQLQSLANNDERMQELERVNLQETVGDVMNIRHIIGRIDRIRPHHIKLGARWLASQLRGP